jgi:unsaturated rhamnogalacturonyl hydrolase
MPTTLRLHGYEATDIHRYIELLIHNLVNIKDTTGRFLLKLDDGRIIDTKGEPFHAPHPLLGRILTWPRME